MKITMSFMLLITVVSIAKSQPSPPRYTKQLNVAVFVYPGVGLGDLNGPVEVFTKACIITEGQYNVYTVALRSGYINTHGGAVKLTPDYTADKMPKPDILIIPGTTVGLADSMRFDPQVIEFIKKYQDSVDVLMSICTAAYFVGQTGAFDGYKVTTHFLQAEDLQEQFPKSTVIKNVRFVDEGKIVTASGVTAGLDASLHLIARFSGRNIQKKIENAIQYIMREREPWPQINNENKFDRLQSEKKGMLKQSQIK